MINLPRFSRKPKDTLGTEALSDAFYGDEPFAAMTRLAHAGLVLSVMAWLFAAVLLGVLLRVATQGRDVVHIVEVYPGDHVIYRGTAPTTEIKDVWVETQLREWLYAVRRRSDDPVLDAELRTKAQRMTTGEAFSAMQAYIAREQEADRKDGPSQRQRVTLSPTLVNQESPRQWRIVWTEEWIPRMGTAKTRLTFDGLFVVEQRLSKPGLLGKLTIDAKDMAVSPLGVFVKSYRWAQVTETQVAVP